MIDLLFVGIDLGKDGGFAVLDSSGRIVDFRKIPLIKDAARDKYDVYEMKQMFGWLTYDSRGYHAFIEEAQPRASFDQAYSYGLRN